MAPESRLRNPMDPYLAPSFALPRRADTANLRMPGVLIRQAQRMKFFAYDHRFDPLGAGAIGTRDAVQIDGDADFHLMKQAALALENRGTKVRFELSPLSESFNQVPFFISSLGSGRFPIIINPAFRIPRNSIFTAIADDRRAVADAQSVFFAHFGAKVYQSPIVSARRYELSRPFAYVINLTADDGGPGAIPAGETRIQTLRADGDSDFDIQKVTTVSDGPITVQLNTEQDNWFGRALRGELLGSTAIELSATNFSGELPMILPPGTQRLISGAGYITATVVNLDAVNANRVQITFWGQRLYPAGGF